MLAAHRLPRSETGTFEDPNCFSVVWEVCLEERQHLHFQKGAFFSPPFFQVNPSKVEYILGKAFILFCLLTISKASCLQHLLEKDLPGPPQQQAALPGSAGLCPGEKHSFPAPSRSLGTLASLTPPAQLKLSKVQHYGTCGIKRTLGAHCSAEQEQKNHTPQDTNLFLHSQC